MSHISFSSTDRRVLRTRAAILAGFRDLFFEHGFAALDVQAVVTKANVGRSTFYKHFRDKDELLILSMQPLLACLAGAGFSKTEPIGLLHLTQHFWSNRRHARAVFSGRLMPLIVRSLAEQIEVELGAALGEDSTTIPTSLIATQLAHAQIALLDHWLKGRGACNPIDIAATVYRSSRALLDSHLRTAAVDEKALPF